LLGECVPRAHLYERVHHEVGEAVRRDLPSFAGARVLRRLRLGEVRERRLEPARQRRRIERSAQLAEELVVLRDLPEEEVDVGPYAGRRVRAEVVEALGEVVDEL